MIRTTSIVFLVSMLLAATATHAQDPQSVETELHRMTQELLDAIAPGNVVVWQRYLDERAILVDETGAVRSKAEVLKELTPLPAGLVGSIAIDKFTVEVHGDVAVTAHEDQEQLDYHGQALHSRFRATDTWLKTRAGWRLIGEQVSAVQKDPPSAMLSLQQLCAYNGLYTLTDTIAATVQCGEGGLKVDRTGRATVQYVPETPDVFFVPGEPRTRRIFTRDGAGAITGFVDRREGEDIRWIRKSAN